MRTSVGSTLYMYILVQSTKQFIGNILFKSDTYVSATNNGQWYVICRRNWQYVSSKSNITSAVLVLTSTESCTVHDIVLKQTDTELCPRTDRTYLFVLDTFHAESLVLVGDVMLVFSRRQAFRLQTMTFLSTDPQLLH